MSTPLRVAAFVTALVAVFALAAGVGRAVGPLDLGQESHEDVAHAGPGEPGDAAHDDSHGGAGAGEPAGDDGVAGLTARADGLALVLADRVVRPAGDTRLAFRVETSGGRPLLDYEVAHEKELHLILVRRDLTGFQHLHPVLDRATGTWSTTADLTPGTWRVVADFVPAGGEQVTLADDLAVAGRFAPVPEPVDRRTDEVDGYEVTLDGDTAPGSETRLTATVTRGGEPVVLQPYLGARGHLVALRAGDLGYLHVHPEEGHEDGGAGVTFATTFPTRGTYRLFLDFRHDGVVRTADFTVDAGGQPAAAGADDHAHEEVDDHDR